MKTVLIDLGPATSPAPGTARFVTEQALRLLRLHVPWKWKVVVNSLRDPLAVEFAHLNPIPVTTKSRSRRSTISLLPHTKDVDLVFATAYFVPAFGPRVISNFFDSNIYEHFQTWTASGKLANAILIRILSDYAIYRSTSLFILSEYCADFLKKRFKKSPTRFIVAPPGCPQPQSSSRIDRPTWMPNQSESFLLYVGTFSENKNQRRLVEAYISLQKAGGTLPPLVVIGPCESSFFEKSIAPSLRQSPDSSRIVFPGRVADSDLRWAYAHALAYIQPSIAEGFGLPVVEAMSYGLPVACSNTTSLPETAGDAAILFDPQSVSSISRALEIMAFDVKMRQKLKKRGEARWRQFTWEVNASAVASEIERQLSL